MTEPAAIRTRLPSPPTGRPPRRPPELEDALNRWAYHPLAARLARALAPTAVTPDMVSAAGALAIMLAALAYGMAQGPGLVLLGLALHMGWHVLDGADGDLARMKGCASPHGELFDGICDYAGHIVLYLTLGALAAGQIGAAAWALMLAAGASRVVQAAHYEGARRQYALAVHGTGWMASETPEAGAGEAAPARRHPFVAYYLWLTGLIVPHSAPLLAAVRDPARALLLREAMRARGPAWLGPISPLSANYRTLAVGAAMWAGRPQWYFVFEVVVLGLVLAASLVRVRRAFAGALADAQAQAGTGSRTAGDCSASTLR
ncbi:CDP-alcohol phosphatidyltransferase family protein [Erythrobacter sp. BLCC-B19]|uniref:CDP-alcohol phosphatidyltransferase family protein n=1 Tax=Erythrobacter sp. BLCC-B19 TaxID=3025315 RepID=UPI00235F6998|nr:CDP-alcohol phosphatidyltransferase family protein [Erythrobacter sp. BLCC-B19]WDA41819.1 CDP-alcohol phosphatidyltransferase family protein [Erythrobacter sp. BLCC-B19]